ncbi:MAG: hypothetical protein U0587_19915 [Candidatus Binatia bacterium]
MKKTRGTTARAAAPAASRPIHRPPLTRLVAADALRKWAVPTLTFVLGLGAFILHIAGVIQEAAAVAAVGLAALLTVLFYGLRSFLQRRLDSTTAAGLVTFALLWGTAAGYPLYRAVEPGAPLYSTELTRHGPATTLPLQNRPGHYSLIIEGHFLPEEGHVNRTAAYKLVLGHAGAGERVLQGAFSQTWGTQRVGAGRRSSIVPSLRETTLIREPIDNPSGADLTLQLSELSPGVRDAVTVRVYGGGGPRWVWLVIGLVVLAGAIVVDSLRPKGANEGLMTTMTVATIVAILIFRASSAATPGFPQFAVAALMGTLAGALGGTLLWRLTQPLRRYVATHS